MTRATGVGGIFLRAADPEKLHAWYEEHPGVKRTPDGAFAFFSEGPREMTVFAFFPKDTEYFGPGKQQVMVNLRVDDHIEPLVELRRLLGIWRIEGVARVGFSPSKANPSGMTDLDTIEAGWIARGLDLRFRR